MHETCGSGIQITHRNFLVGFRVWSSEDARNMWIWNPDNS
jgi:hypothetical protein